MTDNKKEIERTELHRTIWAIADEMRGSVDGWDFKSYILGMLFYRYISENITNYINRGEWESGNKDFDYADLDDAIAEDARDEMVSVKGFFILPSQLFSNVCKVCDKDDNLNETLERIFTSIEASAKGTESEDDFKGLFADLDVNSNKLGATVIKRNEKLVKLLHGIEQMNLGDYQDNTIDAFGDAYEYLMAMYASNAGKSGGEYYTPQEVSELLTKLATLGKTEVNKVYDPACGSGSLLLKAAKILGKENVRLGFYGQEINLTTYNLCRINMFLHDIDYDKFDIACEDTLITPMHWDDEPFEVIVSNPPYSIKWKGDDDITLINDPRYAPAGVLAPKSKADLAFIMHSLSWLATNGTAAIVCFPGVMYRGGAEKKIRQYLIDNNFVDCIIQLPDNLFYGTSIATCIMVLKKAKKDNCTLFIDASKECVKVTNNNKLAPENIQNILQMYADRADVQYLCKLVSNDTIAKGDYNLSVSSYVEQKDTREKVDIVELNARLEKIVAHENELRKQIDDIIKELQGTSKIEQLIQQYCPEGVEWVKLGKICQVLRGKRLTKSQLSPHGKFKVFHGGIDPIGFYDQSNREANTTMVINVGASAGIVGFSSERFWSSDGCFCLSHSSKLSEGFMYYYLQTKERFLMSRVRRAGIPTLDGKVLEELIIPLPPLPIQKEIVRLLDTFSEIQAELQKELQAEQQARQQQYDYYRDRLLTFNRL